MEWQLFPAGTVPEWTTPEWYAGRDSAPHLEQEGHRQRLLLTADLCRAVAEVAPYPVSVATLCDLGAGDGGLLSVLQPEYHYVYGYDLQQTNVDAAAGRGVRVELGDVVADPPDLSSCNVLVATEMLEHLLDPHLFLRGLREATGPGAFLVASSPYTETIESHYDFHTWAWNLPGYKKLLEDAGWSVLRQETAWISQVLLAVRRPWDDMDRLDAALLKAMTESIE